MALSTMTRLLFLLVSLCVLFSFASPEISRNVRSDVSSLFFSPFRVVGKRNQFYGLYKKQASDYPNLSPYQPDYLMY